MPEDLEQYFDDEKDEYNCPGCNAFYDDREVFRLHLQYCAGIDLNE